MGESSKQQVKEVRAPLPMEPERFDTEYEGNGVSNFFMFFSPLEGKRHVSITDTRTAIDWAYQIKDLIDNQSGLQTFILCPLADLSESRSVVSL